MAFQECPGLRVGGGPVFTEDADMDGALAVEFAEMFLDGDADVSAFAGGTVAVNDFEDDEFLVTGRAKFAIELREGFAHERHAGFEIDHGNGDRWVATAGHGSGFRLTQES